MDDMWNPRTPAGFKITSGYHMLVPVTRADNYDRDRVLYYRHGITKELYGWLIENIGSTCGQAEWQGNPDATAQWIYTGSQTTRPCRENQGRQGLAINLRFRQKSQAMMFKLAWMGRL